MRTLGRKVATLCAVLALAGVAAGCSGRAGLVPHPTTSISGPPTTGVGPAPSKAADGLVWILTRTALADVAEDPSALAVVKAGHIYELVTATQTPVPGIEATITDDFASYAGMSAAIQDGDLVHGATAVLYDPESWTLTPRSEQVDVPGYIADAVELAHEHGLQIIVTPALDLTSIVARGATGANKVSDFLASGIEQAAAAADIVDVQAQSLERTPTDYATFVLDAATAIHARRAGAIVVAGLSTNPAKGGITAAVLAAAIDAVSGHVQGYWLNMPVKGRSCGGCSPNPNPGAGTGALDSVFG